MNFAPDRRLVLSGLLAAPLAASPLAAFAQGVAPATGDIVLGDPDASLTVYEYVSYTCPACAAFHMNTWPEVKANYVDTGKVKFIVREIYRNKYDLWASMTARCGGEKGFYPMVDTLLKQQSKWSRSEDIGAALNQVGRRAGLSNEQLSACLADQDYAKELLAAYQKNAGDDGVRSTPSFVINGEVTVGGRSYEEFSELLEAAL